MIIRIILLIAVSLYTTAVTANTCRLVSKVCVDAAEPKIISGHQVYFAEVGNTDRCWDWKSTYDCIDSSYGAVIDYCAPLAAIPSCSRTSSICSQFNYINSSCDIYTDTYRCGDPVAVGNVIQLNDSYTLSQDNINYSTCSIYSQNASCQLASEVCTDGPSTKVVLANGSTRAATAAEISSGTSLDGVVKSETCWAWKRDYTCLVGNYANYCQPLVGAGCTETAAVCKSTGWDGSCLEYERTYNCNAKADPVPTNVVFLNSSYTIVGETTPSTCDSPANNANCTPAGTTCVDGPATKVVYPDSSTRLATASEIATGVSPDGAVVTKACWETKSEFTCATTPRTSTCQSLQSDLACTEASSSCIDYLPGGQCGVVQHVYNCKTGPDKIENITNCSTQTYCLDGSCFDTGYAPDADFGKSIAYMEALRQAANYGIFRGEASSCYSGLIAHCCKSEAGGYGGNNNVIANTLVTATAKWGAEEIYVMGSKYLFEGLMNSGSEMLMEYAMNALSTEILSMSANFSIWGAEFSVTASESVSFVGFDGVSLVIAAAMLIYQDMSTCEESEMVLAMRRGQGLCHRVGSWCSASTFGSCTGTKEGWCCFPSKLGRIVNQQGRPQVGKSWGTARNPDCSGFTIEELALLRFDQMDLSEFIADITASAKSSVYATDRLQTRGTDYYAQ